MKISYSLLLVIGFALIFAQAHMSIWVPSMYGREPTNPTSDWLAQPLQGYDFVDWWMHGKRTINDPPTEITVLPAGGTMDFEITGNKWWTTLGKVLGGKGLCSTGSPGPRIPVDPWDNGWHDTCNANVHAPHRQDVAGCALGIAYKSDINAVRPEDFVIFSVAHDCIARQLQAFDIPMLPPCQGQNCICSWFWIHNSIGGTDQMYMTAFKCSIGNAGNRTIAQPSAPVRCDGKPPYNGGPVTTVCKKSMNPMYWANNQGNNMANPTNTQSAPTYTSEYGFPHGAQHQIFTTQPNFPNSVGDTLKSDGTRQITSNPTEILYSPSGNTNLTVQGDGNVVLFDNGRALWSTKTAGINGAAPYKLIMQSNGNLELQDNTSRVFWASKTVNLANMCAPYKLKVRDINSLKIVDCNETPIWSAL